MDIVRCENWQWRAWLWGGVGAIVPFFVEITFLPDCVNAQPVADTTLGAEQSQVIPVSPVDFGIDGGVRQGSNLFHSFREFNVPDRGSVYFLNPTGVENILSRVTGNTRSDILGILGVLGNANLFLINPNGIIFGPNASLDVGGSFVATTANAIQFGDRGSFSATVPTVPSSLLTIEPSAFLFNQMVQQPQNSIESRADLRVPSGQSLLLLGGNISPTPAAAGNILLEGSGIPITTGLVVLGGRVEVGSISGAGTVELVKNGNQLSFQIADITPRANIFLLNGVPIGVFANSGSGDVVLDGRNITLAGGSLVGAGVLAGGNSANSRAGDIRINATGDLSLEGESRITNQVTHDAVGQGGNVIITTTNLFAQGGSQLTASTFGLGNAGNLTITVRNTASFDGESQDGTVSSGARSTVQFGAVGNGGNFNLTAGNLSVTNGAELNASTFGQGNAGNLTIAVRDTASFDGETKDGMARSGARTQVDVDAVGNGGNLSLTAGNLFVTNGAKLSVITSGRGRAGNLTITVRDTASFDGENRDGTSSSSAASGVNPIAVGNGGDLNMTVRNLFVTNGAQLNTSTSGHGRAGNLTLTVSETASFNGEIRDGKAPSAAGSRVESGAVGDGGNFSLTAGNLFVSNGAQLSSGTFGSGRAGSLTITVRDTASFDGTNLAGTNPSAAASGVGENALGDGGNLSLTAGNLFVTNGALLTAGSLGQGKAGNLSIHVRETLQANGGTFSTLAAQSSGGAIALAAKTIRLFSDSDITTSVFSGAGGGGDVTLTADSIIALGDSDILAFARDGRGGNITLNTRAFFGQNYRPVPFGTDPRTLDGNRRVDVNATGAVSGIVSLPDVTFIQNSLTQLPQVPIDTNALLANSCIVRRNQPTGNFFITGSGGLPERPDTAASPTFPTGEVQNVEEPEVRRQEAEVKTQNSKLSTQNSSARRPWKIGDPIVEPQGVYELPDGQLVLSRACL